MEQATATLVGAVVALLSVLATQIVTTLVAAKGREHQLKIENQRAKQQTEIENSRADQQLNLENHRAQSEMLRVYLEQMEELLLDKQMRKPPKERTSHTQTPETPDDVRLLARAQTLTVLQGCDRNRKRIIVQFLYESRLIQAGSCIVDLSYANLQNANLEDIPLKGAELRTTDLRNASLSDADLSDADLGEARGVTNEELDQQAKSLKGATMPTGQKYEDWLKDKEGRGEHVENGGSS